MYGRTRSLRGHIRIIPSIYCWQVAVPVGKYNSSYSEVRVFNPAEAKSMRMKKLAGLLRRTHLCTVCKVPDMAPGSVGTQYLQFPSLKANLVAYILL